MNVIKSVCLAVFLALAAAVGVSGCTASATDRSAGQFTDDAALTARVKTALARDDQVKAMDINVQTYRGVVQLSGFVNSTTVANRAEEVVRDVPGVVSVKNDLRVKTPPA